MCGCVCVCVYSIKYIYIYTHTHTHTELWVMEDTIHMALVTKYKQHESGINNREPGISPRGLTNRLSVNT